MRFIPIAVVVLVSANDARGGVFYDEAGAQCVPLTGGTMSGNLDMGNNLVLNIGNASTDFTAGGGLNVAGTLAAAGNETVGGTLGVTGASTLTGLVTISNGFSASNGANAMTFNNAVRMSFGAYTAPVGDNNAYLLSTALQFSNGAGTAYQGIGASASGLCLNSTSAACVGSMGALTSRRATLITSITNSLATTGLSVPLVSGATYLLHVWAPYNNTTAGEGVQFDFNGNALGITDFRLDCTMDESGQVAQDTVTEVTTLAGTVSKATLVGTGAAFMECDGAITPSATGNFIIRFAEAGAHVSGTLTLQRGAYVRAEAVP